MKACEESIKIKTNGFLYLCRFLKKLFARLDRENVSYCVLRNYESLPDHVENDIDLLVYPKHIKAFRQCLLSIAEENGWELVKNPSRYAWQAFWLRCTDIRQYVEIDIVSVIHWKSMPWINAEKVLAGRRHLRQFYIPDRAPETATLLIKDLIQGEGIKAKYFKKIQRVALEEAVELKEFLGWSLGSSLAAWLCERAQQCQWQIIENARARIRLAVISRSIRRNPLAVLLGITWFLWGHLWACIAKPAGMFVVLIGPDGSGKSAVTDGLLKYLRPLFRSRYCFHGRFGKLPRLRTFVDLARNRTASKSEVDLRIEQNISRHSLIRIMIYVIYYSFDYLIGHYVIRRAQAMGKLVIFDRYFYDWFIQDSFARTPRWLLPILKFVFPRPDLVVYLHNSSDVIHQRKPELTVDKIDEQNKRCRRIVEAMSYGMTVSTNPSVDKVVQEISKKIEKVMAGRLSCNQR